MSDGSEFTTMFVGIEEFCRDELGVLVTEDSFVHPVSPILAAARRIIANFMLLFKRISSFLLHMQNRSSFRIT